MNTTTPIFSPDIAPHRAGWYDTALHPSYIDQHPFRCYWNGTQWMVPIQRPRRPLNLRPCSEQELYWRGQHRR